MEAKHRIVGNVSTVIANGNVVGDSPIPSTRVFYRADPSNAGNGELLPQGAYTGKDDANYTFTIVDNFDPALGISPPISTPNFVGIGNGTIEQLSCDVTSLDQTITFTLANAGTPEQHASVVLGRYTFKARVAGMAGNGITITVDRSNLVFGNVFMSLIDGWPENRVSISGAQYDMGGLPLDSQGRLQDGTKRVVLGSFGQVYRPYKAYQNSEYINGITPPPNRVIPKNTQVREVTGDYSVVITNGVITETYTGITDFDILNDISSRSQLIVITDPIAESKQPKGMSVTDVSFRTSAYAQAASDAPITIQFVEDYAPSQIIEMTCVNDTYANQELFEFSSPQIGWTDPTPLPQIMTNKPYTDGLVHFTLSPLASAIAITPPLSTDVNFKYEPISSASRPMMPCLKYSRVILGAAPLQKTFTFTWTKWLPSCKCEYMMEDGLVAECIGLDKLPEEENSPMGRVKAGSPIPASIADRREVLSDWFEQIAKKLVTYHHSGELGFQLDLDRNLFKQVAETFLSYLYKFKDSPTYLAKWDETFTWVRDRIDDYIGVTYIPGGLINSDPLTKGKDYIAYGIAELITAIKDILNAASVKDGTEPWGIDDPFGDASGGDAEGCWQNVSETDFWEVSDNQGNDYVSALLNKAWHSFMRVVNPDTGMSEYRKTNEVGVEISVSCPEHLRYGDKFIVNIKGGGAEVKRYRTGDKVAIEVVGASGNITVGGADADLSKRWAVASSAQGTLPDYTGGLYSKAGFTAKIVDGTTPFIVGDRFTFDIIRLSAKWQKNSETPIEISLVDQYISDGISLNLTNGRSPSFVAGDKFYWEVDQMNKFSNSFNSLPSAYRFKDSTDVTINFTVPVEMDLVMLANLKGKINSVMIDVTPDAGSPISKTGDKDMFVCFDKQLIKSIRIRITGNGNMELGWAYAGVSWQSMGWLTEMTTSRGYSMAEGGGMNARGLMRGKATSYDINFTASFVTNGNSNPLDISSFMFVNEFESLIDLLDHAKEHSDESIAFIPNVTLDYITVGSVKSETVDAREFWNMQGNHPSNRFIPNFSLSIKGNYAKGNNLR